MSVSESDPADRIPHFDYADRIPLVIRPGLPGQGEGSYSVKLAGIELALHLAADGLRLEWTDDPEWPAQPVVTLKFAPFATEVDLDAEVIKFARQRRRRTRIRGFFGKG